MRCELRVEEGGGHDRAIRGDEWQRVMTGRQVIDDVRSRVRPVLVSRSGSEVR